MHACTQRTPLHMLPDWSSMVQAVQAAVEEAEGQLQQLDAELEELQAQLDSHGTGMKFRPHEALTAARAAR